MAFTLRSIVTTDCAHARNKGLSSTGTHLLFVACRGWCLLIVIVKEETVGAPWRDR